MNHIQSEASFTEACQVMPGGVNSPVRAFRSVGMAPIFIDHAKGSTLVDEDGNQYIDYICSWGPMILGHNHPLLQESLQSAMTKGLSFGLPTSIEVQLAEQIIEAYQGVDMVRMVNSGTEATMSAIRVARGYTGKDKIIKFEGCYHGHSDGLLVKSGSGTLTFGVPTSPGVPEDIVKNTLVCQYNSIASVQETVQANPGQIAAIIIEPIAGNMGVIPAQLIFLQQLRELCTEEHIILIFDEVISGFRIAYGGAAAYYGVTPDMACFGKIIGGGLPVGAYGGRRTIMEMVSPVGPVYQAGTLSGNPLAMHLGSTLLTYLKENPQVYEQINHAAAYLETEMTKLIHRYHRPYQVSRCGSLLTVFFTEGEIHSYDDVQNCDTEAFARYFRVMLQEHVMIAPSQYEAMFVSDAHTQHQLDATIAAFEKAMMISEIEEKR
ncbi:MAG: glutamate-1-semialdehyde 2,1-aminomutase [Lachnospiraceae bacterium]